MSHLGPQELKYFKPRKNMVSVFRGQVWVNIVNHIGEVEDCRKLAKPVTARLDATASIRGEQSFLL